MVNNVVLVGRMTKDAELRTTTTGKNVASFSIAVQKRIKPQDGSPDSDFFQIVAWGSSASFVTEYLGKGRLVSVEGRLQSRKYTTGDGSSREVVEVVADSIQSLDRPRDDASKPKGTREVSTAPGVDEYDPFADE